MESKNYENKHVFLVIGILLPIFSPILLLMVPRTTAEILHKTNGVWEVFLTKENIIAYGIGILLLSIACLLIFFLNIRRISIVIGVILTLFGFSCFYLTSQSYKALGDESISFRPLSSFKDYNYSWDEVEKVIRTYYASDESLEYEFVFKDGERMKLKYDKYASLIWGRFTDKVREKNLIIESIEK